MTFFFLVVGLEARREIDLGDLRDRGRLLLPVAAGMFGMVVPVALYLAVNAGGDGAGGWGVAMSTDTALALGLLVVVGRDVPGPGPDLPAHRVRRRRPRVAAGDRGGVQPRRRPALPRAGVALFGLFAGRSAPARDAGVASS